jgi:hypothetical protein
LFASYTSATASATSYTSGARSIQPSQKFAIAVGLFIGLLGTIMGFPGLRSALGTQGLNEAARVVTSMLGNL